MSDKFTTPNMFDITLNNLRNECGHVKPRELKVVAANHYIVHYIKYFHMVRKNMTLEDLENAMLAYDKFLEE